MMQTVSSTPPSAAPTRQEIVQIAATLAAGFASRAAEHDRTRTFPHENYAAIREAGYPSLTVPTALGGWGATMLDAVLAQEQLGMGDGSTALAIAMHVQSIGVAASGEKWNAAVFTRLCQEVTTRGVLVNACATEPELGSPSRGGRPATTAKRVGDHWIITGRKTFASMSPELDYFIVPAAVEDADVIMRFLIPRGAGVSIEETWESMGMRSTGSHDLILDNVQVSSADEISVAPLVAPDPTRITLNPWFTLLVSAVYLGIAAAAQQAALAFARTRIPTALGKPIATLEGIQRRLGEGELKLHTARMVLYRAAEQYDRAPDQRESWLRDVFAAKLMVTNQAISIVDDAMRVVGGVSMTQQTPLERYYRDVRAGLYHPPMDDIALPLLGRIALNDHLE